MATNCFERFDKIVRVTRQIASICGADFLKKNYKMNFLTWFVIIAINAYFCCTIYTIYNGFVVKGDWKIILQSLSLAGSAIQGYSKLLFGIQRRRALVSMHRKLNTIYKEYQDEEDYFRVLRYRTDLTTKILFAALCIYVSVCFTITLHPLVHSIWYGEKMLIMQFFLPGIDPKSDSGHLIHNAVHLTLIIMGAFGNFAGDMYIFIFITNIPLLKDVLQVKCKQLNRVILNKEESKDTMPLLKEVINCHQSYNVYAQEVEEAYYGVIFVQVSSSVMSISFTLFSIIIRSWPAGFAYLIYSFSILYAYCGLGHLVELSNDDVIDIIYGDILWYELSAPEQKLVLLMLRKSQAPITLTIGQIMPLSMSTALQLTKAIYSYMMMLVNFLETDEF